MSLQPRKCALCQQSVAPFFCFCDHMETLLCEVCVGKHQMQFPTRLHRCMPLAAYGHHTSPGYFQRFEARSEHFALRRTELTRNLQEIDNCEQEFVAKIAAIIAVLQDHRRAVVEKLHEVKANLTAEMETAVAEAERLLYHDVVEGKSRILTALRNPERTPEEMKLFTYEICKHPFPASLNEILKYETEEAAVRESHQLLPCLLNSVLQLSSLDGQIVKNITLPFQSPAGAMCQLRGSTIYILGGVTNQCYVVDVNTAETSHIANMTEIRGFFGLHTEADAIYAFGGRTNYQVVLKTNECFSPGASCWDALPSMSEGHYNFTPCKYREELYLVDPGSPIEIFDLMKREIRVSQLEMPGRVNMSVSAIVGDELITIGGSSFFKYRVKLGTKHANVKVTALQNSSNAQLYSSHSPIVTGNCIVWAFAENKSLPCSVTHFTRIVRFNAITNALN